MKIHPDIPLIDTVLGEWRDTIGSQFGPYRNHVYRVVNFCFALHECRNDDAEKLALAGCLHDLGIWSDNTVDYLAPSMRVAREWLVKNQRGAWATEIGLMIDLHHKFRRVENAEFPLVEVFRKGDWVDASMGMRKFGLAHADVKAVQDAFPNLGFHQNLMRLAWEEFKRHPLNPLPMMRW
jgi:hypothetical protein